MKRILSLTTMLLFTIASFAYDAKINGIYYNIDEEIYAASVTHGDEPYSGEVVIPKSFYNGKTWTVTSIDMEAFSSCSGLISVSIPSSVTEIGWCAFEHCSGLTSVDIPSDVKVIGNGAFQGCSSLTSVIIPYGVDHIGWGTFYGCSKLTSVTIPNSVLWIEDVAFQNCSSLISVTIPNSVRRINPGAFSGCSTLNNITIGSSVESIGQDVFSDCSSLTSITIPNSVVNIGPGAFRGCDNINHVYSKAMLPPSIAGNTFFDKTNTTATLHVPVGTVALYRAADYWKDFFKIVDDITIVYIDGICYEISGDEATVVQGNEPYSDNVVIPNTVVYDNKTYDVTKIDDGAFKDSPNLVSVTIPESVTVIGEDAFSNCPNLVTIYNEAINPQVLTGDPGFDESTTVHVPEGSKDSYKNADYWKDFSNIVDDIPTAINNVSGNVYLKVKSNFSIDGKSISQPQKGMNIQKMSDGTTIKVLKD